MESRELADRLLEFGVRVGRMVDALPNSRLGRHISGQLLRSGTSPAANYEEACAAESRKDFVHKLSICLKELRESRYWMRMTLRANLLPIHKMAPLLDETDQLAKIIAKSIITTKSKRE